MKPPFPVIVIGCLIIAAGMATLFIHLLHNPIGPTTFPILILGLSGIASGIFLFKGHNWARWFVLAWLAFHVVVAALNSLSTSLAHLVLLIAVAYSLFSQPSSNYFKRASSR
jgi:hypothetical protein